MKKPDERSPGWGILVSKVLTHLSKENAGVSRPLR
jgi:hypothetical protein